MNNNPQSGNPAGVPPNIAGEQLQQGVNADQQQPPSPEQNAPPPWQNTAGYAQQAPPPPPWPPQQDQGWQGYPPQQPPPWAGMPYGQVQQPPPVWVDPWAQNGMGYGQVNPQVPPPPQNPPAQDAQTNAGFTAMLKQLGESAGLGDLGGLFAFDDKEFWKGAVVGAAAILLLTNENVRDTLMGGIGKAASAVTPDAEPTAAPVTEATAKKNNSEES